MIVVYWSLGYYGCDCIPYLGNLDLVACKVSESIMFVGTLEELLG